MNTTDCQRITITIDAADLPGNDIVAVETLLEVVRHLQNDGIYPSLVRLEIAGTPATP